MIRTLKIDKQHPYLACTATQDALEDQIKHVLHVLWLDHTPYHPYDPYDGCQDTIMILSKHLDDLYMIHGWTVDAHQPPVHCMVINIYGYGGQP